jgi:chemotaxis protein MotA
MTDTTAAERGGPPPGARPAARPGAAAARTGAGRTRRLDTATIVGLGGGFALIAVAIALGGAWTAFVDLPSLLIVVGGTLAVTTVSFSMRDMLQTQKLILRTLTRSVRDAGEAALQVLELAEKARRTGLLSLQSNLPALREEPYLARGLTLVVDGAPGKEAEQIMRAEMLAIADRHQRGARILYRAAEVAPAMGLIGTLVGLVQMLGRLDDPSTIGPAMAVALLTTFYGAILGNMVFAPLAGKLEKKSTEEALVNEIYLLGVGSIGRQENPRRLELMINTILPPAQRVAVYR